MILHLRNYVVRLINRIATKMIGSVDWDANGEMRAVSKWLNRKKEDACVIDIGANDGRWAAGVQKNNPHAYLYCFEPIPIFFDKIPANDRLKKINVGLGLLTKKVTAYSAGGGGSLLPEKQSVSSKKTKIEFEVQIHNGDDYLAALGINGIDYIKIDVDGTELDVILGLQKTIEKFRPAVQFEFGYFNYYSGTSFYSFYDFFQKRQYQLHTITKHGLSKIGKYRTMSSENPINLNYLALPVEKLPLN
ncbi:MAG: FkbM family methyltransferase [bacterium]